MMLSLLNIVSDTRQLTVSVKSTGSIRSRVASSGGLDTGEKGTS